MKSSIEESSSNDDENNLYFSDVKIIDYGLHTYIIIYYYGIY